MSGWERERRQFLEERGVEVMEWERNREESSIGIEKLEERDKVRQRGKMEKDRECEV